MANIVPGDIKVMKALYNLFLALTNIYQLALHVLLVKHGRETCKAGKPNCGVCPLTKHCAFYQINEAAMGEVSDGDKENVSENVNVVVSPRTRIIKKNLKISASSDEGEDDDEDYNEELF